MAEKTGRKSGEADATQVFRQFAWNLAGTLARRNKPASARKTGGRR